MRRSGAGDADFGEQLERALRAPAVCDRSRCVRIVSISCRPIVYSGLSEVSGSWKIAPISRPRTRRIASAGRLSMRRPSRQDLAAADASRRVDQADDRRAGQRLAGAGFADDAEHLAAARSRTTRRRPRPACRAASEIRRAGARPRAAGCARHALRAAGHRDRLRAFRPRYSPRVTVQPAIGST